MNNNINIRIQLKMDEVNYEYFDKLDNELKFKIKEQKKILNNVSLTLVVWALLVSLGIFVSNIYPETQSAVVLFGILSVIPVAILECKIAMKLSKVTKEKTQLEQTKSLVVVPKIEDF